MNWNGNQPGHRVFRLRSSLDQRCWLGYGAGLTPWAGRIALAAHDGSAVGHWLHECQQAGARIWPCWDGLAAEAWLTKANAKLLYRWRLQSIEGAHGSRPAWLLLDGGAGAVRRLTREFGDAGEWASQRLAAAATGISRRAIADCARAGTTDRAGCHWVAVGSVSTASQPRVRGGADCGD